MNKFISLVLAAVIAVSNMFYVVLKGSNNIPEAPQSGQLESYDILNDLSRPEPAKTVYTVELNGLSENEKAIIVCLQGILAQTAPRIYTITCRADNEYIKYYSEKYGIEFVKIKNESDGQTAWKLVDMFKNEFDCRCILYGDGEGSFNAASSVAGIKRLLTVHSSLKDEAVAHDLTVAEDFSSQSGLSFEKDIYRKYKNEFCNFAVVHLREDNFSLRDFGIMQKMFIFHNEQGQKGDRFKKEVFGNMKIGSLVFGWGSNEKQYVKCCSENGTVVIPSDYSYDLSFNTVFRNAEPIIDQGQETKITADKNKHYIALMMSDGDNVQWTMNDYSMYYKMLKTNVDVPITFTLPPLLSTLAPAAFNRIVSNAKPNYDFISGCSGIGYFNPSYMKFKHLNTVTAETAYYMEKSGFGTVSILDDIYKSYARSDFENRIAMYARFEQITGGILQLDPNKYLSGGGQVYFANDKPFLSVRFSLWSDTDDNSSVTYEWLSEQAEKINGLEADITSINGYSLINIHPWSITPENIECFISLLGENIEIVSVNELLALISENVPHLSAMPE